MPAEADLPGAEDAIKALPRIPTNVAPPISVANNKQLAELQIENDRLKVIARDLHWMARRYADGRQSYATSLHNDNTRALLAMGVALNATGDGTLWARDSAGRAYDELTDEEAAQGRVPDWKHDDKERRIEELEALVGECEDVLSQIDTRCFRARVSDLLHKLRGMGDG